MSLRNRFVLPVLALLSIAMLVGCGSSSNKATAPPTGGFSVSNFNGAYAFSAVGIDAIGAPFALEGSLQANGSGGITGGALDLNDLSFSSGPIVGTAITGGHYSVTSDGRGQATLNTSPGTIVLDFVLLNNSHALVTEFDSNGTGSGTMDIESSPTQAQFAGSYAFSFGGSDNNGNAFATAGSFTLDANGNITAGVQDLNDAGVVYANLPLTGSVTIGSSTAPGTATLTATGSPFGSLAFDVYAVDSTHIKLVESDVVAVLAGDAYTQQGASLPASATTLAFMMQGGNSSSIIGTAGYMAIDGAGSVPSGAQDINLNGTVPGAPLSFTGSYAPGGSVGLRNVFTLTGFSNAVSFAAYPTTSAGVLMIDIDGTGTLLTGGAMVQASGASIQSGQGYGMNVAAVNIGNLSGLFEEDDIAEFATTSTTAIGLVDYNDEGTLTFDQHFTGNYSASSSGAGTLTTSDSINGNFYAIDGSSLFYLETDTNQVGTGSILLQTPGAQVSAASRVAVMHASPAGRAALRTRSR